MPDGRIVYARRSAESTSLKGTDPSALIAGWGRREGKSVCIAWRSPCNTRPWEGRQSEVQACVGHEPYCFADLGEVFEYFRSL